MRKTGIRTLVYSGIIAIAASSAAIAAPAALDADARIQTLVYNENDVFRVVARNGFQTNIELAEDETIDTISIGDSIGWQLTPTPRRIFVKPLQKNGVTNLSVITNKRSYQFELVATGGGKGSSGGNAYVVKFYYPEDSAVAQPEIDRSRGQLRPVSATAVPELPSAAMLKPQVPSAPPVAPKAPSLPTAAPTLPTPPITPVIKPAPALPIQPVITTNDKFNFNYTLTGPDSAAPVKIYDDGRSTFFQFRNISAIPQFFVVRPDGSEVQVAARPQDKQLAVVDQLSDKFVIKIGGETVRVFNENNSLPPVPSTRPY